MNIYHSGISGMMRPALIILLSLISTIASSRDYSMGKLHVNIELLKDGSMWVTEHRSFTFEGRYSQIYRTFPVQDRAVFSDFTVFEGDTYYRDDGSETPGSFRLVKKPNELELQVNFDARDTTRVFGIRFRVHGAVNRHEDASLLYYQIISDEWTKPIHQISAIITPPIEMKDEEVLHWVHGSPDAISTREAGGVISLEHQRLPAGRYLEIRALYPRDAFPGLEMTETPIREAVLEETAALADEANRMRQLAIERQQKRADREAVGRRLVIPVSLIYLLIWISLFRRYGKRVKPSKKTEGFSRLPDKEKPAIVHYLTKGSHVTGDAMIATLFHLAYRRFLEIREEETSRLTLLGKKKKKEIAFVLNRPHWEKEKDMLPAYEHFMIDELFLKIAGKEGRLSLRDMKKKPNMMRKFFTSWKKKVSKEGKTKGWFDKESETGRNIGLAIGISSMLAFIALAIYMGPFMLIVAGLAFVSIIAAFFIFHRTASGEIAYQQWQSLKKHLKKIDFSAEIENLNQETVNEFLIYGMALGLGPKYFKRIAEGLETSGHTAWIYWIILHNNSMSSFSKTINEVITTTSSTMSSAAGAGGGGTMGGGGGVASGGGGAR